MLPPKSGVLGHVLAPQYDAAAIAPPSRACRWFIVSNTPALPRRACAVHLSMACRATNPEPHGTSVPMYPILRYFRNNTS